MSFDGVMFGLGKLTTMIDSTEVELGDAKGLSIEITNRMKYEKGGGSITDNYANIEGRDIKLKADWLVVRTTQLARLLGGSVSTGSGKTTHVLEDDDVPLEFKVVASQPSDGTKTQLTVFRCICEKVTLGYKHGDYSIPNAEIKALKPTSGSVMEFQEADA